MVPATHLLLVHRQGKPHLDNAVQLLDVPFPDVVLGAQGELLAPWPTSPTCWCIVHLAIHRCSR